jgi:hypothetical protein
MVCVDWLFVSNGLRWKITITMQWSNSCNWCQSISLDVSIKIKFNIPELQSTTGWVVLECARASDPPSIKQVCSLRTTQTLWFPLQGHLHTLMLCNVVGVQSSYMLRQVLNPKVGLLSLSFEILNLSCIACKLPSCVVTSVVQLFEFIKNDLSRFFK